MSWESKADFQVLIASLCPGNHLSFRLPTATVSSLVCSSFPVRCVTGSGNRVSSRRVTRCSIANRRLKVSLSFLVQLADILCYLCFVPASPVGGKKKWGFHVGDGKFSFCIIFFFFLNILHFAGQSGGRQIDSSHRSGASCSSSRLHPYEIYFYANKLFILYILFMNLSLTITQNKKKHRGIMLFQIQYVLEMCLWDVVVSLWEKGRKIQAKSKK